MKTAVFGISMLVLAGLTGPVAADVQVNQSANPEKISTPSATAPASLEKIKEKIEAMNSHSTPGLDGVVKMHQSGVDKSVIETYIKNSRLTSPTPRDIIYLHDQGIPQELVNAIIDRGRVVEEQTAKNAATAASSSSSAADPSGVTYNNFVYNAPSATSPSYASSGYDYSYANNSSVVIIPYNPYRSYYRSYFSPPFYSPYGWPYSYSSWYSYDYCPPYSPFLSIPYRSSPHFAFNRSFSGPHFSGPIFTGGNRSGGPSPGRGPGGPGFGGGHGGSGPGGHGFRR